MQEGLSVVWDGVLTLNLYINPAATQMDFITRLFILDIQNSWHGLLGKASLDLWLLCSVCVGEVCRWWMVVCKVHWIDDFTILNTTQSRQQKENHAVVKMWINIHKKYMWTYSNVQLVICLVNDSVYSTLAASVCLLSLYMHGCRMHVDCFSSRMYIHGGGG